MIGIANQINLLEQSGHQTVFFSKNDPYCKPNKIIGTVRSKNDPYCKPDKIIGIVSSLSGNFFQERSILHFPYKNIVISKNFRSVHCNNNWRVQTISNFNRTKGGTTGKSSAKFSEMEYNPTHFFLHLIIHFQRRRPGGQR